MEQAAGQLKAVDLSLSLKKRIFHTTNYTPLPALPLETGS